MEHFSRAWLIHNPASGSNDEAALAALHDALENAVIELAGTSRFPDDPLPTPDELDAADVPLAIIYTGDGTANAAISKLQDWRGAVLFLPGGTMNLLGRRLHGESDVATILRIVASGAALRCRPPVIRSDHGIALAGLLAGPGTSWASVREAMRAGDIAGIASDAVDAIGRTTQDEPVHAVAPRLGRAEGYPLLQLTPGANGIALHGYYAETAGDLARQGFALLRRNFREGPHDSLGLVDEVEIASDGGAAVEMLLDGEPVTGLPRERFTVAPCGVDLLATGHGD
ncbi:MAG: hypothetical protein IE933_09005 [Sphingomonadales bacterium]|nr:hypothetical protein [Sphingomonadales bacterium]MBD3773649.1 hypothetical protein [Paracoccaceae bacterium]